MAQINKRKQSDPNTKNITCSASSNQSVFSILLDQPIGRDRGQAHSRGAKRMSNRQGSAPLVELLHRRRAYLTLSSHVGLAEEIRVQRLQIGQNLARKRLVKLKHVNVAHIQSRLLQHLRRGVRRTQQQLVDRVLGDVRKVTEIGDGFVAHSQGGLLGHDQGGGGAVGEVRRVGRGHGAVGFNEGSFQFG